MKKYKWGDEALVAKLIDLELAPYGKTFQDIKKEKPGKKNPWYDKYTFNSEDEYNKWKKACIKILKTQTKPKFSDKIIEREFAMFDLCCGLKQNYERND